MPLRKLQPKTINHYIVKETKYFSPCLPQERRKSQHDSHLKKIMTSSNTNPKAFMWITCHHFNFTTVVSRFLLCRSYFQELRQNQCLETANVTLYKILDFRSIKLQSYLLIIKIILKVHSYKAHVLYYNIQLQITLRNTHSVSNSISKCIEFTPVCVV